LPLIESNGFSPSPSRPDPAVYRSPSAPEWALPRFTDSFELKRYHGCIRWTGWPCRCDRALWNAQTARL